MEEVILIPFLPEAKVKHEDSPLIRNFFDKQKIISKNLGYIILRILIKFQRYIYIMYVYYIHYIHYVSCISNIHIFECYHIISL